MRTDEHAGPSHYLVGISRAGGINSVGGLRRGYRQLRKARTSGQRHRGGVPCFVLPNLEVLNLRAPDGGHDSQHLPAGCLRDERVVQTRATLLDGREMK